MKKTTILISSLILFGLVCSSAFADEQITITTYYPSPYGVYKTFRIYPSATYTPGATCTADQEGEIWQNTADHLFYICEGNPLIWKTPGYWKPDPATNPNNIININTGYVKAGPIAIGLTNSGNPTGLPAPALGTDGANIGVLTTGSFQVVNTNVSGYMDLLAQNVRAQGVSYSYNSCIIMSYSSSSKLTYCPPGSTLDMSNSPAPSPNGGIFYCCY